MNLQAVAQRSITPRLSWAIPVFSLTLTALGLLLAFIASQRGIDPFDY